ncbi:MAG: PH domain-containing protein [Saprospiraceae bacterium]|nr:PH domain-containing protein [Saprospiraceae bacterium]
MYKIFSAAVSPFIASVLILSFLISGLVLWISGYWILFALDLILFGLIGHAFFTAKYIIADHQLQIRFGLFHHTNIDIYGIRQISKTRDPLSSPAPSLDRLRIDYGQNKYILLSPKDKSGFIRSLTEIQPNIQLSGALLTSEKNN